MPVDPFDNEKAQAMRKLATIDKSKKGSVDKPIESILEKLNAHPDFYTTSSCSGRVLVLTTSKTRRKDQSDWPYTTHGLARAPDVLKVLGGQSLKGDIWLKQESAILHIACRDINSAERLLDMVRNAGFKRAGIIGTRRRVMIEIIGTDAVAIPIGKAGHLKVDDEFIRFAVKVCNERMRSNQKKLKTLESALITV